MVSPASGLGARPSHVMTSFRVACHSRSSRSHHCWIVTVTEPIVIVPARIAFPFFFETANPTVPELIPDAPDVIVIHGAVDLAVHGQPPLVETEIIAVPAVVGRVK
jgi:hypothetical protein